MCQPETSMKKVRYAVVGAGWISQEAFLPAVAQTGNSEVAAIVSGDLVKAKQLAAFYGIRYVYPYEQFDAMARSGEVDAWYCERCWPISYRARTED